MSCVVKVDEYLYSDPPCNPNCSLNCFLVLLYRPLLLPSAVSQEVLGAPPRFLGVPSPQEGEEASRQDEDLSEGRPGQALSPDGLHGLQGRNDPHSERDEPTRIQ